MNINDAAVDPAHKMFCEMVRLECDNSGDFRKRKELQQYSHADYAAYAIRYCALKFCDDMRTAKDVCQYAGTATKRSHRLEWYFPMFSIGDGLDGSFGNGALSSLLQRVCFDAGVSRIDTIKLLKIVEALRRHSRHINCRPTTLVASCVYLFCLESKAAKKVQQNSLKGLCTIAQVSTAAVSKTVKLIRTYHMTEFRQALAGEEIHVMDGWGSVDEWLTQLPAVATMTTPEVEDHLYEIIDDANLSPPNCHYYRDMPSTMV